MNLLNWHEEMALGIEDIDRQHYMFYEILGRLHEAAGFESSINVLKGLAGDLACYASLLFRGEENLIALTQDPNACSHLMEHAEFRHRVVELEDVNVLANRDSLRATAEELGDWLENHIAQFDRPLARRVRKNHEPITITRPVPSMELPWLRESVAS
ncbi:hemerythrin family protein [uncultured Paludibaculum sp.]|uniref:bacteriohemerythrin n=1 Tax=uncultured Paludibaculum sp. TaxID=1765020 RepID=UPI002AAA6C08|nr:hemerythrin family protein [uncultured Paludibaculum sp.]